MDVARPVVLHAPGEAETAEAVRAQRPDLIDAYHGALPGARAAILGRLWGALAREPLPGVRRRDHEAGLLTITLADDRLVTGDAGAAEPFAEPVRAVTIDGQPYERPDRLVEALRLPGASARLARELDNSVANLALARSAATQRLAGTGPASAGSAGAGSAGAVSAGAVSAGAASAMAQPSDLPDAEQSIVDGHPLHPCCRTRIGLSTQDVLAYAPEHRPVIALRTVAVPAGRWLNTGTVVPPLLPVHPAQLQRVLDTGLVRLTGPTLAARPLMSLRTVALVDDPGVHVKTALDVQMTSAVRRVSPAAIRNGPAVSALLAALARRTPALTVLREFAAAAVLVDGEPDPSMAAVWREAPRISPDERVLPLAALTATAPGGRPPAMQAIADGYGGRPGPFLTDVALTVLPPLLHLLHLGAALEAHGQNTLVVLRGGRPVRVLYRDLGGIRISPRRLAAAGVQPPRLYGSLTEDDPTVLATKLVAAAVSTVFGELVATLSRRYGEPPGALWVRVAAVIRSTYTALPRHAGTDRAAFGADTLPIKAMTAMRLAEDPVADLWASIPNPMAGLS